MNDQQRTETAADNCEVLRARLARYEDGEGRPVGLTHDQAELVRLVRDLALRAGKHARPLIHAAALGLESQARELERQKMNCLNLLQQLEDLKAQPSGVVLPEPEIASEINRLIGLWDAKVAWSGQCMEELLDHAARAATLIARLNSSPVSAGDDRETIRAVFLRNGFTIKEGQADLKPYVYAAADELMSIARAALSAPSHGEQVRHMVLAGWKLVPVEPTPEMISAASGAITKPDDLPPVGDGGWSMSDLAFRSRYRAAIAAAPSLASQKEQG